MKRRILVLLSASAVLLSSALVSAQQPTEAEKKAAEKKADEKKADEKKDDEKKDEKKKVRTLGDRGKKADEKKDDEKVAGDEKKDEKTAEDKVKTIEERADEKGKITVMSEPSGEVFVDGAATGQMTPLTDYDIAAGEHEIQVKWDNGELSEKKVLKVRDGSTLKLMFRTSADKVAKKDGEDEIPDSAFEPVPEIDPDVLEDITPRKSYPYVENHGMFRFRADAFHNLDLNTTGTSPILPPPEVYSPDSNPADPDAEWYSGANIRFRYTPTFHVYEDMSVTLQMDLPDNLVLGSYPDGALLPGVNTLRPDIPKIAFSGGQLPPSGRFDLRLKQAYGQVKTFFGLLRVGRQASHWGLGILANNGQCIDCDYGDAADRITFITKAFGFYVIAGYDFPNEGPISYRANDPLGQPRDQSQLDDVNQWVGAILYKPLNQEEKARQIQRLKEERKPVINGGLYVVYRTQEASFETFTIDETINPDELGDLEARSAEAIIPDLWLQFLWEPQFKQRLRLELEVAAIQGTIGHISLPSDSDVADCFGGNATTAACTSKEREVNQLGFAFEGEFKLNQYFRFGLNAGYATGRNSYGFQLNDGKVEPEAEPSNFKFDRDYIVDMILFREIIGAVTNATYFKPWVQFDFWTRNNDTFGIRLDTIYSMANDAEATPSAEAPLGLELDSMLFYSEEGKFRADLAYGVLLPLAAFKEVEGRPRLTYPGFPDLTFGPNDNREPDIAQTVQARMFWFF